MQNDYKPHSNKIANVMKGIGMVSLMQKTGVITKDTAYKTGELIGQATLVNYGSNCYENVTKAFTRCHKGQMPAVLGMKTIGTKL